MFSNSGGRHQFIKIGLRQRNIYMCRRLILSSFLHTVESHVEGAVICICALRRE